MSFTPNVRTKRATIRRLARAVAVLFIVGSLAGATQAASGGLDPTFGSGGLVTTAVPNRDAAIQDVALQPDGKIVAAGWLRDPAGGFPLALSFLVARYNVDGTLDASFGSGGLVTATVGSSSAATAVAIQADGKIVAGGLTLSFPGTFALARFNTDGTLDSTFGSGGKVVTDSGFSTAIHDIGLQADGKIVVGGGNSDAGDARNFMVARYQTNGVLDSTFGSGGISHTNFFGRGGLALGLAIQPDGKIVEVGVTGLTSYPFDAFGLVRFNSDGTLDTTFGAGGKVTTGFGGGGRGWDVVVQPDGKLVAAGVAFSNSAQGGFGLARYNVDGSPDTSFGDNGTVLTLNAGMARAVALQSDGKIVAAGDHVTPTFSGDFAVARYRSDGSPDSAFGSGGIVTTDFGASEAANGVAIQSDGKIVAGGVVSSTGNASMGLARYLGADSTPPELSVSVTPNVLRPPNHKYVAVHATVSATDDSGVDPAVELVSVTSNEPDNAPGDADGNTTNDIVRLDDYTFNLRAERNENASGRIYTIIYLATDASGNTATQSATLMVPISP